MQEFDLAIHFVYTHFAHITRLPTVAKTAKEFDLTRDQVKVIYRRLYKNHFFLELGSTDIIFRAVATATAVALPTPIGTLLL